MPKIEVTAPATRMSMQRSLRGKGTTINSTDSEIAQTVSPAIMVMKAGALGISRRRQANSAKMADVPPASTK